MAAEDMAEEFKHSWQAVVTGYARLRHGLLDLGFPSTQMRVLASLMRYAKIMLATAIASLSRRSTVARSTLPALGSELDFDTPVPEHPESDDAERVAAAEGLSGAENGFLRDVVSALCSELTQEIHQRGHLTGELAKFNSTAAAFREDADVTLALRERIRELQSLRSLGAPVPVDPQPLVTDCTALNVALKEQCDRLRASSLKLRADKFALLTDKGLLLDRVRGLEARAVVSAQNSSHYRHSLARAQKQRSALLVGQRPGSASPSAPSPLARPPSVPKPSKEAGLVSVGGVDMEPEVVEWLREMYNVLSTEGAAPARSAAGSQRSAVPSRPASAGGNPSAPSPMLSASADDTQQSLGPPTSFATHVAELRKKRSQH
eukprot:TRINITY_DN17265_c0_g1_i1.p1 TRINITY_DN17265_c0_g1~~TRINITY_DN17265_c0_g1_i1.p1  ORF type:complete len:397 (+),score=82.71 TRINITY_DN17265_c0_g1_i1:64-1191(+)